MSRHPLLCIAGGGTGGHVMPALALADAARQAWPSLEVQFIGALRGLEATLLPERKESVLLLPMHSIKGARILQRVRVLLWELPRAIARIRKAWRGHRPDLVVGVGGYASASGVIAALSCRIPVVLYEQNAMPGMVNRILGRFCDGVMLGFAAAGQHLRHAHAEVTGNMVRDDIAQTRWHSHEPPMLLVMGGSQGARFFNETVPRACAKLAEQEHKFRVTHLAGEETHAEAVARIYTEAGIDADVRTFCRDMAAFYASGDLLLARAGAMTVSEAAMCGMPCLFVPLPHAADNHQWHNARVLERVGAARILLQPETDANVIAEHIRSLLFDPELLERMSAACRQVAPLQAKEKQLQVLARFLPIPGGTA